MMTENRESVINELKFIGKVKKGEKINVKYMCVQPDGIVTKISRTLINPDTRTNALSFIRNTINKCFSILDYYMKSNNKQLCINIIRDLENSKQGIHNLKSTYADDTLFCCSIDTLIERIDVRLKEVSGGSTPFVDGDTHNDDQNISSIEEFLNDDEVKE